MEIKKEFPHINFLEKEPMSRHTTFRIGGPAGLFASVQVADVAPLVSYCKTHDIPVTILGNGSNVLVGDQGIEGLVLSFGKEASAITVEGNQIRAEAGALLSQVANAALEHGLGGLAFAAGIPGTIGGAVCMNAGAYGGEMKDVLKEVTVLTPEGGVLTLQADELHMGYRTSVIKEAGYIVLEAVISLEKGDQEEIRSRMQELAGMRTSKQPLSYPSAGSTFKRPEGYFAGKLIMDSGLRGYQVGGAQVSEKHCGFVINTGNATAKDVTTLMSDVQRIVLEKFGVKLEPEVKFLGEF